MVDLIDLADDKEATKKYYQDTKLIRASILEYFVTELSFMDEMWKLADVTLADSAIEKHIKDHTITPQQLKNIKQLKEKINNYITFMQGHFTNILLGYSGFTDKFFKNSIIYTRTPAFKDIKKITEFVDKDLKNNIKIRDGNYDSQLDFTGPGFLENFLLFLKKPTYNNFLHDLAKDGSDFLNIKTSDIIFAGDKNANTVITIIQRAPRLGLIAADLRKRVVELAKLNNPDYKENIELLDKVIEQLSGFGQEVAEDINNYIPAKKKKSIFTMPDMSDMPTMSTVAPMLMRKKSSANIRKSDPAAEEKTASQKLANAALKEFTDRKKRQSSTTPHPGGHNKDDDLI